MNNRFEYVKTFEQPDILLPNTWIVVRIDGRGFHKSVSSIPCPDKGFMLDSLEIN